MVIDKAVKDIIAEVMYINADTIQGDYDITTVIGCDSLERLEICQEIEHTFSIDFADRELKDVKTVTDLIELTEKKVEGKTNG